MPPWVLAIRGRVPRSAAWWLGLVPMAGLLAAWWLVTRGEPEERVVSALIMPSPREVLAALPEMWAMRVDGDGNYLLHNLWTSLRRVALGFLIGAGVALPLGIAAGAWNAVRALFSPLMTASGYIPIATLVPLTMSWFGTGERQKIAFLAIAFAIYLLPLAIKAVDGVADVYLRTARTLGASDWQLVRRVLVPIAGPDLWHGLRLAFGVGWTYIVLTEAIVREDGVGAIITLAQRRAHPEQIYLMIILITVIAWLADIAWVQLGRRLFPYRQTER